MDRKKALLLYIAGAFGQIWLVCIVVFFLRRAGITVDFTTPAGLIAVAVGGTSAALWGAVLTVKYRKYSVKQIVKDFFNIKQNYKSYLLVMLFLLIDFAYVLFGGGINITSWYAPIVMFITALLFGGIEEMGWRYFFQPVMQEKRGYILSTLITFLAWGVWHFSYFYIDGSLPQIDVFSFSAGLLTNCFILSTLFNRTKSLWICVMTHSLINVLSQTVTGGNIYVSYFSRALIILLAVFIAVKDTDKTKEQRKNGE